MLSANLWNGRGDPRAFADLVASMDVDVVAVQECAPEQAEALTEVMPHGLIHPSHDHMGMGLALKNPAEVRRLELPHRGAYRVELSPEEWPGLSRPAEVLNVHFAAPHTFRTAPGITVRPSQMREFLRHLNIGSDGATTTTRPKERVVQANADTAQSEENATSTGQGADVPLQRIVVGDFNATPLWPLYWRMSSQFTDAALAVARQSGRRAQRTWGPWPGSPRLLRIDHGFVTKGMRVDEFQAVPVRGSDHSAIVMDVLLD